MHLEGVWRDVDEAEVRRLDRVVAAGPVVPVADRLLVLDVRLLVERGPDVEVQPVLQIAKCAPNLHAFRCFSKLSQWHSSERAA